MSVRHVAVAAALAMTLSGCSATVGPVAETGLDSAAVRFSQLQDDLVAVNQAQAATVGLLRPTLDAFATVDLTVPLVADPDTIDEGLARVPVARIALDLGDMEPVRPALLIVAAAVDDARLSLRRARSVFEDQRDIDYLDATDLVLVALRDLSAAQDALAQVVERHLPVYENYVTVLEDFSQRRSRFRSRNEAADALSVETRGHVRDIGVAQADVATFLGERDVAAQAVTHAQAVADAAFEARGTDAS